MAEQIHQVLADFGRSIGIDGLVFDEYGYCCLSFDEIIVNMELVPKTGQLMLYAHLGFAPQPPRLEFYERLLQANHFFRETGGATIGLDPDTRAVALTYLLPQDGLALSTLEAELRGFVDIAESWTQRIQRGVADAQGQPPTDTLPPMMGGWRA